MHVGFRQSHALHLAKLFIDGEEKLQALFDRYAEGIDFAG